MLEKSDPFCLRLLFDYCNFFKRELGDIPSDARFLRALRRALLTTPFDAPRHTDTNIFPPLEVKPHSTLAGKRVGMIVSGGSGSLVALCGIKRALEEADIEIAAISVCSGGAIWGSMIAAGWTAQQMVNECLCWMPSDIVRLDWPGILKAPWTLFRGFEGLAGGETLTGTLDRAFGGITLAETEIPYYAIVLNITTNRLGYFGPHNHPEVKLATMVGVAIALPLFVKPIRIGGYHYVDGGVVNIFPADGLLETEEPFDYFIGVNTILPPGFDGGENITGWEERPGGILEMSKQLWHTQHIELARQQLDKIRDKTLLLEPLSWEEISGSKFYEIFLDNQRWPEHILTAYHDTKARLAELEISHHLSKTSSTVS